jgi:hypothetical protein
MTDGRKVFILVATSRFRPGRMNEERRRVPGWVDFIERHDPRLIAFHEYLNEDRDEISYLQVHRDAASFEHYLTALQQAGDIYKATLESTTEIRIYGSPTERTIETLLHSVGTRVPITIVPTYLGGYTRTK